MLLAEFIFVHSRKPTCRNKLFMEFYAYTSPVCNYGERRERNIRLNRRGTLLVSPVFEVVNFVVGCALSVSMLAIHACQARWRYALERATVRP